MTARQLEAALARDLLLALLVIALLRQVMCG